MRKQLILVGFLLAMLLLPGTALAQKAVILVLPFQVNVQEGERELTGMMPEEVASRLAAGGMSVISPDDAWALVERQQVSRLDLGVARDLGTLVGASDVVYGSLTQVGESISIDVRLVDASGLRPARPLFVQSPTAQHLPQALDDLAERIIDELTQRGRLADIQIRGLRVLDEDVVLLRLNHRKGDPVDAQMVNQEIRRIWDMGYFSDVRASVEESGQGLVLVYTVAEKPRVENIVIEGSDDVDADDVIATMGIKIGSVLNEKLLAQDLQRVADFYHKEGYYLAHITHRVETNVNGATLVLTVEEGNKLYIKEIRIEGAEGLDEDDIKDELVLSERRFWSWITGSGVLKEDMLERDSQVIGIYGMNQGFLDIMVSPPNIDYQPDGIVITFAIKEGPRYKVGEVSFDGDLIDTDEALYELVKLDERTGKSDYFAFDMMQDDARALTEYYGNYGYAFADVNPRIMKDEGAETPTVNISYLINKRQKVYINRVSIDGNAKTRDNVILRELRLTDGDMFSATALGRSAQRLHRLQYFDDVQTQLVPTENPEEVDLLVTVKEGNTGSIMGGVGYSSYYDMGVTATIMERNLFGKGYMVSLRALLSGGENSYSFSFTNPRINDGHWAGGLDLYLTEQEYDDFDKDTLGGRVRAMYPLGEYTDVMFSYRLDRYKLYNISTNSAQMIRDREGYNISSVVSASFTRDTTDSRENPTQGTYFDLTLSYGGGILMGDDNFFKPVAEISHYYSLAENHVLHGRLRGGMIFKTKDNEVVPVFERFYIGGMNSIRGYRSKDISPRESGPNSDSIGGDRMAYMNLEYIWTFQKDLGMALVPFFDMGFVLDAGSHEPWSDEIKRSIGLELRWKSPMGPLRFAYGYPLDDGRYGKDVNGRFEFSMGHFF